MFLFFTPANMSSSGKDGFPPNRYPKGSYEWGIEVDRREDLIETERLKDSKRRSSIELQILREKMRLLTEIIEKKMDAREKAAAEEEEAEKSR